jgi:triosephosphate isomerase (TIM)
MIPPIFAANWKMNLGPQEARVFLQRFTTTVLPRTDRTFIFFPPAISLAVSGFALRERPEIVVGVQNIHWEDRGAFTGENSATMARDAGAKIVLVGHSERRQLFGETDEMTAKKCAAAYASGLVAMLCVGERLEERERTATQAVVLRQLKAGIGRLEPEQIATMLIAYEPVWAIGTGLTATPEDATNVHTAIRRALREAIGARGGDVPILYGGSVNAENVASLIAAPEVHGVLVGGASLDADGWAKITQT